MADHDLATALSKPARTEPPAGFAARLRDETKLVHREAERTGFLADLIRGRATRRGYALFLRNLVPVYAALEHGLAVAPDTPLSAPFRDPALWRLPSLDSDLAALEASEGSAPEPLPESSAYARAIDAAAANGPPQLVAHAYARYLGDLSGGQILKPILARSLGLDAAMLRFYDFPEIPDADIAKRAMRAALDTLTSAGPDADIVCAEAIVAFRHNIALSQAVSRVLESVS